MKKIAIIGTVGIPAKYGGFETLAEHLTSEKSKEFKFTVHCSSPMYSSKRDSYNNSELKYWPLKANGIQSVLYDIVSMLHAAKNSDLLLILGISGCIFLPILKLLSKKKVIVNMDGLEWKRDKWGKFAKWFSKFSEKMAIKHADTIIADNEEIKRYVKAEYKKNAVLIAYGADHVERKKLSPSTLQEFPYLKEKYAFKVCRIEPENNIHLILETFAELDILNIIIVGNWNNSSYGIQLKQKYDKYKNIFLLDPIYDQAKLNQLRSNCSVYIHGHSAGGTNPSLIEAMYLRLPILAYNVNYNKETTKHKALYFQDNLSLKKALLNLDEEILSEIGSAMFRVAKDLYTWKRISGQYADLFASKTSP